MIAAGENVDQPFAKEGHTGLTPLILAIMSRHPPIVHALLQAGVDVDKPDKGGRTPLIVAIQIGGEAIKPIIYELIERGNADVNKPMNRGVTPLIMAAANGDVDIIELLLSKGAEIDAELAFGYTALCTAIANNHDDVSAVLIEHGADVNKGKPLVYAITSNRPEIVRLLLEKGANTDITIIGSSLLDYASSAGLHEIADILEQHIGANINAASLPDANVELEIANVNRPTADVFNPIAAMELPFDDVYNDEEEVNVVFKLGTQYFALPVARLQQSVEERTDIHYACRRQLHGAPRSEDVDHENPFFLLRGIGIYMIPLEHIMYILRNPDQRLYELIDTGVTKKFTAGYTSVIARGHNRDGAGRPVDIVSADHCQEGTARKIYTLKALRIVAGAAAAGQSGGARKSRRRLKRKARKTRRKQLK